MVLVSGAPAGSLPVGAALMTVARGTRRGPGAAARCALVGARWSGVGVGLEAVANAAGVPEAKAGAAGVSAGRLAVVAGRLAIDGVAGAKGRARQQCEVRRGVAVAEQAGVFVVGVIIGRALPAREQSPQGPRGAAGRTRGIGGGSMEAPLPPLDAVTERVRRGVDEVAVEAARVQAEGGGVEALGWECAAREEAAGHGRPRAGLLVDEARQEVVHVLHAVRRPPAVVQVYAHGAVQLAQLQAKVAGRQLLRPELSQHRRRRLLDEQLEQLHDAVVGEPLQPCQLVQLVEAVRDLLLQLGVDLRGRLRRPRGRDVFGSVVDRLERVESL